MTTHVPCSPFRTLPPSFLPCSKPSQRLVGKDWIACSAHNESTLLPEYFRWVAGFVGSPELDAESHGSFQGAHPASICWMSFSTTSVAFMIRFHTDIVRTDHGIRGCRPTPLRC